MSNKHVNHQHGLTTMNATRPKSKLRKRANKLKATARKAPLLLALQEAKTAKNPRAIKAQPEKIKAKKKAKA